MTEYRRANREIERLIQFGNVLPRQEGAAIQPEESDQYWLGSANNSIFNETTTTSLQQPEQLITESTEDIDYDDLDDILPESSHREIDDTLMMNRAIEIPEENINLDDMDDEDDAEDRQQLVDIASKFASWSSKYNIAIQAVDDLMNWFRDNFFHFLPKSIRTIRSSSYSFDAPIRRMGEGEFFYFGIKKMIEIFLDINENAVPTSINHMVLCFATDGVPISRSSRSGLWPIMMKVLGFKTVLLVGLYHGPGKPPTVEDFMQEFAPDLENVLLNGLQVRNMLFTFSVGPLVFDSQAKSFVLDIKAPTGFYSCPKCVCKGTKTNNRVVFPNLNAALRTHESFLNLADPIHHCATLPPLAAIGVRCIENTAIDYMHAVLLGVFKTLLKYWVTTKKKPFSLNQSQQDEINRRIQIVKRQLPSDFARCPRTLDELNNYKATELRLFLLYTGPILFLNVVKDQYYQHFLLLHSAIRILCHPELYITRNNQAEQLLTRFVNEYKFVYGREFIVHNVHVMIHLAAECRYFNMPLDGFSAFPYEEFLQKLIKMIKKAPKPTEQIRNRIREQYRYYPERFRENEPVSPKLIKGSTVYDRISNKKSTFRIDSKDDCICWREEFFIIKTIMKAQNRYILKCRKINNLIPLYVSPMTSSDTGIFVTNNKKISDEYFDIDSEEAIKALQMCLDGVVVYMPLIHTA